MFDIQIVHADILQLGTDNIVCPIYEDLTPASPVGQRIWDAAGQEQMQRSCQYFFDKPYASAAQASDTLLETTTVWSVRLKKQEEMPHHHWYIRAVFATCKEASVAIPVPVDCRDGIEIGAIWRRIFRILIQAERGWTSYVSDRRILLVTENELACQIGRLILQEELDARQKKLSENDLRNEQQKAEYLLAKTIDREKLAEGIIQLQKIGQIQWVAPKQLEDGVWQFGYPVYPKELFLILHLMEPDYQYPDHLKQMKKQKLRFSDLSLSQIQTYLTYLHRGERFCDGLIAEAVNHGTLMKLLLRIHDLINPYPW